MLQRDIVDSGREYHDFLLEFLLYHDMSSAITSKRESILADADRSLPIFITEGASSLFGVTQGLINSTAKTRQLRDRVRKRRNQEQVPYVDFATIMDGRGIDTDLKTAVCPYENESDEWVTWNLYRTTFWLYLHRTLNNSVASPELDNAVNEAIRLLQAIPADSSVQSVLLTPTFIIACAAFNPEQRPAISVAFETLEEYSNLGNIKHAREVVENVWVRMDAGNDTSWDWEGIMEEMGLEFLIT